MSTTLQPDRILRELSELWVSFGKQDGGESTGVLRACAMTLLVVAGAEEDAADVGETLASLMRDHPSRAIVVRVFDAEKAGLEARVFAQCWMPLGHRRQIEYFPRRCSGCRAASVGRRPAGHPVVAAPPLVRNPGAGPALAHRLQDGCRQRRFPRRRERAP
jgi:hypothetical protein